MIRHLRPLALLPALVLLGAAGPDRGQSGFLFLAPTTAPMVAAIAPGPTTPQGLAPAPVPDHDASAPIAKPGKARDQEVVPTLFTSKSQYRGDGFDRGSTNQAEREKKMKPGAGLTLRMPLQPSTQP